MGAISSVDGADGVSLSPHKLLNNEVKISLYDLTLIFCPKRCSSKKSPTWIRRMSRSMPLGASRNRRRRTASRVVGIMRITIEYIIAKMVNEATKRNQNLKTLIELLETTFDDIVQFKLTKGRCKFSRWEYWVLRCTSSRASESIPKLHICGMYILWCVERFRSSDPNDSPDSCWST